MALPCGSRAVDVPLGPDAPRAHVPYRDRPLAAAERLKRSTDQSITADNLATLNNSRRQGGRVVAALATAAAIVACAGLQQAAGASLASPGVTRVAYGIGQIVPIPASIPHEAGDMVDRRIIPDLRWIAERFPIYVTDGYSGRLPRDAEAAALAAPDRGALGLPSRPAEERLATGGAGGVVGTDPGFQRDGRRTRRLH